MGNEIADHAATLAPAQQQVDQAEQVLAGYDARNAIALAQAASETATLLLATLDRYTALRSGIVQARHDAERLIAEGYRMEASQAAIDGARTALSEAGRVLQTQGPTAAAIKLEVAQTMLTEAIANGTDLPTLRAENDERLKVIEAAGVRAADLIAEGRRAFDLVDEFAPSTWSDIRGNGSEAEAAAARAHEHWQSAQQRNTMEVQAFHAAKEDLDAASEELTYVQQLIDAITNRLRDLEQARATAREILAEAERSIGVGWQFVRSNDADVGKDPEAQLQRAQDLLKRAQSEAANAQPNWLILVRDAQEADQLADAALVGARSEAETMAKLRQQVEASRQLAEAEVTKLLKFAELHREDLQAASSKAVADLGGRLEQAHASRQRAEQLEEGQRQQALNQSLDAYRKVHEQTSSVYAAAQADFQRLEQLRTQLNDELTKARQALQEAESLYASYKKKIPNGRNLGQRLQSARRSFDQIRLPIRGEEQLNKTIKIAQAITGESRDVARELRDYANRHSGGSGGGGDRVADVIGGMILNEVLNSGRRHGGWGGSGGWSGGGGGGWSSGGGGGGGGIFGGGGGGGSFGGGGGGGGW